MGNFILFTYVKNNVVCLICRHTITILKLYNLNRRYKQKHSEIGKLAVAEQKANQLSLKNNLTSQQNIFHKQAAKSNVNVTAFEYLTLLLKI